MSPRRRTHTGAVVGHSGASCSIAVVAGASCSARVLVQEFGTRVLTEKLKVQKVSFSETDGVSRAPLPDWRRYVPYSAPHPEADDMVLRGVVRESTWKSSGWIGACRLRVQGESSPWEHGHNLRVGLPTVSSWTRLLESMCRQKWGGLPYFQLAVANSR